MSEINRNAERQAGLHKLAEFFGCDVSEFKGRTLRSLFTDAERFSGSVRILWGCWTAAQLDEVV